MTKEELKRIYKQMLWVIPGMLLAMVGNYCMGVEPKGSYAISGLISSGWLTIADWRSAVSNLGGRKLVARAIQEQSDTEREP